MYVAKVYNTRKKGEFFSTVYYRNFENAVADIGENAECLFGTLPEQDHATLGRLDFCSTSITEAGNSDDFVFLFENGIAVSVCTILCEEDKHTA